jgi:hypothetical protein
LSAACTRRFNIGRVGQRLIAKRSADADHKRDDCCLKVHWHRLPHTQPTTAAAFRFRTERDEHVSIAFEDITCIRIVDVLIQNVASRVLATPSEKLSDEEIERLVRWACSDEDRHLLATTSFIENVCTGIRRGELRFLWLDPSVGAQAVVVSRLLSIEG